MRDMYCVLLHGLLVHEGGDQGLFLLDQTLVGEQVL